MTNVLKGIILLWMPAVLWAAFYYAPPAKGLGETARVIFFHVPAAWIAVFAFCMSLWHSVAVLRGGGQTSDVKADVAARLGLVFSVLATVTGAIFAKSAWNSYWNWDPRETSIVVLVLVYMAYFGLRSAIDDPDRRSRLSAVYAILAFCVMPFLVFVLPRITVSLHPDPLINSTGQQNIEEKMRLVLFASIAGFTGLFAWIYDITVRIERMARKKEGADV